MGRKVIVEEQECRTCKYKWFPKIKDGKVTLPERCPGCNSPYWNKPYQNKDKK